MRYCKLPANAAAPDYTPLLVMYMAQTSRNPSRESKKLRVLGVVAKSTLGAGGLATVQEEFRQDEGSRNGWPLLFRSGKGQAAGNEECRHGDRQQCRGAWLGNGQ